MGTNLAIIIQIGGGAVLLLFAILAAGKFAIIAFALCSGILLGSALAMITAWEAIKSMRIDTDA